MNIFSKLTAVLLALLMNVLILGGVAFLFTGSSAQDSNDASIAVQTAAETANPAA
jgi:Mn2+/Fe2+ NRAMP family transporter